MNRLIQVQVLAQNWKLCGLQLVQSLGNKMALKLQ